jgi:signal transduction histidine kinase
MSDIGRSVYNLRPLALGDLGPVTAIREHAAQYRTQGTAVSQAETTLGPCVTTEAPDRLPALSAVVEVAVYNTVQEALTNLVRHELRHWRSLHSATDGRWTATVTLEFKAAEGVLRVLVRDDDFLPGKSEAWIYLNIVRLMLKCLAY